MKRTDITELFPDATKEQIDKIMSINGADVNAIKTELDTLRQQLAQNNKGEELQQAQMQISQLQTQLDGMKAAETIRMTREKVAADKKIPVNLLTGETEEACAKQADEILAFSKSIGYPTVRDGGEVHTTPKINTKDKFVDWADKVLS